MANLGLNWRESKYKMLKTVMKIGITARFGQFACVSAKIIPIRTI